MQGCKRCVGMTPALGLALAGALLSGAVHGQAVIGGAPVASATVKQLVRDTADMRMWFVSHQSGEAVSNASPTYNANTGTLRVGATFEGLPLDLDPADLRIVVNGRELFSLDPQASFEIDPQQQPKQKRTRGGFSLAYPLVANPQFPAFTLVAELVFEPEDVVLVRSTLTLHDLRPGTGVQVDSVPPATVEALDYQLTPHGLGGAGDGSPTGLEANLLAAYPPPSLESFNERLTAHAAALPEVVEEDVRACVDYEDLSAPEFSDRSHFPAFGQAKDLATARYLAYELCKNNGGALCETMCIKERPVADDFELCVDTVTGQATSAAVGDIEDLQLEFVDSTADQTGLIEADLHFSDFAGRADLMLSDLSVRWDGSFCLINPKAESDDALIESEDWLQDWSTCRDARIDAAGATTAVSPGQAPRYLVGVDPVESRQLTVVDARRPAFAFLNTDEAHRVGTCAEDFIAPAASTVLSALVPGVQGTLAAAVDEGRPTTDIASLLEQTLLPVDLSLPKTVDYDGDPVIATLRSDSAHGLEVTWQSTVTSVEPVGLPVTKILTQPAGPPLRIEYSTDHLGQTVSSQFGVTTQWLNQVLWAVGATRQFNEVMHWTEDQLDAGQGNTPITVFDGKLLADLHPGLRHLRGKPIEVVISRTLDPMVYMPPDPNALIPDVGWPMSLGVYGLQIRFKSPDRVHASGRRRVGKTHIHVDAALYDPDFHLTSNPLLGSPYLVGLTNEQAWQINIVDFDSPNCPKFSHEFTVPQQGVCERAVEAALSGLLIGTLGERMNAALQELVAPQYFVTDGKQTAELQTNNASRSQALGRVSLRDHLE